MISLSNLSLKLTKKSKYCPILITKRFSTNWRTARRIEFGNSV